MGLGKAVDEQQGRTRPADAGEYLGLAGLNAVLVGAGKQC